MLNVDGNAPRYYDMLGLIAYTLSDCFQACLSMNGRIALYDRETWMYCRSIYFSAQLSSLVDRTGANCWIKNGTPSDISSSSFTIDLSGTYLSAAFIDS